MWRLSYTLQKIIQFQNKQWIGQTELFKKSENNIVC